MEEIPIMQEALEMYERGMSTGVNRSIRQRVAASIRFDRDLPAWHREIIMDPQTSGGLLVAVGPSQAAAMVDALRAAGVSKARIVGRVVPLEDNIHLQVK